MAEEDAENNKRTLLQGLKPIGYMGFTPGLKPRPPKEKIPSKSCEAHALPSRALPLSICLTGSVEGKCARGRGRAREV
jgi:hypothetical protein